MNNNDKFIESLMREELESLRKDSGGMGDLDFDVSVLGQLNKEFDAKCSCRRKRCLSPSPTRSFGKTVEMTYYSTTLFPEKTGISQR